MCGSGPREPGVPRPGQVLALCLPELGWSLLSQLSGPPWDVDVACQKNMRAQEKPLFQRKHSHGPRG